MKGGSSDVLDIRFGSGVYSKQILKIYKGNAVIWEHENIESKIAGLEVDLVNSTFTRLEDSVGLSAGTDFDLWNCYKNRKRCNVSDNGTILAWYGDSNYTDDGSNGQVMVYQPKFYYKVDPVLIELQSPGQGYHLRKARYYISDTRQEGFKIHPAFLDKNGNEVDYVLIGAYEATLYNANTDQYMKNDESLITGYVTNNILLSSVAGGKPASGANQFFKRDNIEETAQNRGSDWHYITIQISAMNQLLCMIEMGTLDFQSAIGRGVVDCSYIAGNESADTGATASLGNLTGQATQTSRVNYYGTRVTETEPGKISISYRGIENPFGNIWEYINGFNLYGDGYSKGGIPYICSNFMFDDTHNTNYTSAGFTIANQTGYISAFGYTQDYDWLFLASETLGTEQLPIGDYLYVVSNNNESKSPANGGYWGAGSKAGGFYWNMSLTQTTFYEYVGSRLIFVPTNS